MAKVSDKPATVGVVGGGIIGSWAALHLAEAGAETTLFEQFPLPHTRGSSHGLSRAFRFLGEHELGRLDYSLERWQGLEASSGETLFVKTGLINFGPPGDPDLEHFMGVLRDADRPVEWLDSTDIAGRYPMISYPDEWGAAFDPNGGILVAHSCLNAVQARFGQLGGRIVTGRVEAVKSGMVDGHRFDRIVVCAGPWTGKLLPELDEMLQCIRTPVTYWQDPTGSYSASSGFPILFNARLTDIYGIPSYEYPGLVKMLYHGGPETDPDTRDHASFEPYIDKVRDYVKEHLELAEYDQPAIVETCMYTMTPDSTPIIDRLNAGVVVGCGFSGSGFKHAPATGHMLAALALGQEDSIPAGFRADRYTMDRLRS